MPKKQPTAAGGPATAKTEPAPKPQSETKKGADPQAEQIQRIHHLEAELDAATARADKAEKELAAAQRELAALTARPADAAGSRRRVLRLSKPATVGDVRREAGDVIGEVVTAEGVSYHFLVEAARRGLAK